MAKYSGHIHPFEAGQTISISGKVSPSAERIDIDLSSGNGTHNDVGDIQLHISIRFQGAGDIIRNTHKRGGGWGREERHENMFPNNAPNPIRRGEDFKVAIHSDSNLFFLSINDKPFCYYAHRMPLSGIQLITINRDADSVYQVDHVTSPPKLWPRHHSAFSGLFPRQLRAGSLISFNLTARGNLGSFIFNLRENDTDRILFHMRPYFSDGRVVINDQAASGAWRNELSSSPGGLIVGQKLRFAIGIASQQFVIAFNGRIISSFPFRERPNTIFGLATGFEIVTKNGLEVEVHGVNHSSTDINCSGIERFSL